MYCSVFMFTLIFNICYSTCDFSAQTLSCSESIDSNITFGANGLPGIATIYFTDMEVGNCVKIIIPNNITYLYATPRQMCKCTCLTSEYTTHNCGKRIKYCNITQVSLLS